MLSERRRLSDVATCCSASGDVMHCAGTADHSTHEGTLDTGSTATDRPADTVKNASDSQVVLLYSAGSSFVFENRKRQSGSSEEAKHGSRLRYVGISAAARTPYTARTSLAHTAAQSRLAHCPATSTAAAKPAHKRSLFLIFDEKMSFVRGFCRWRRVSLQRRRPAARGHHPICCSTEPPPATNAREYGTLFVILTARLRKSCRRRAKNRLFGYRTVFTHEFTPKPKATACDGPR